MPCKTQNICNDDDDDSHNNFLASSSPLLSTMLNRKCLQSHISYLFFGHIETSFKVPIAVRLFNNFSAHMVEASVETEIFWFTKYLTVLFNSWEQIFSCQWLFPFFCYIYIFYFICYTYTEILSDLSRNDSKCIPMNKKLTFSHLIFIYSFSRVNLRTKTETKSETPKSNRILVLLKNNSSISSQAIIWSDNV